MVLLFPTLRRLGARLSVLDYEMGMQQQEVDEGTAPVGLEGLGLGRSCRRE